jgi:hypothetical protein
MAQRRSEARGGELNFDVDAALLFELGEHLVTRKSVALAELVKNAYDADATRVTLTFSSVATAGGTITVSDNGSGMTFGVVRDGWMRIATTTKRANAASPRFHRPVTGAKGAAPTTSDVGRASTSNRRTPGTPRDFRV